MKPMRRITYLLVLLIALPLAAQSRKTDDRLHVSFDRPVAVSKDLTLQPGNYVFQQVQSRAEANTFHIFRQSDKKAMGNTGLANAVFAGGQSPTPQTVAKNTRVEVLRVGNKDYLDKIWYEGQNKGYSFDVGQDQAIEQARNNPSATTMGGNGDNNASGVQVVRVLIPATIGIVAIDENAKSSSDQAMNQSANQTDTYKSDHEKMHHDMKTGDKSAAGLPQSDQDQSMNQPSNTQQPYPAQSQTQSSDQNMSDQTQSSTLPQSHQGNQTATGNEREFVGCVTGPFGGSYMLTTATGDKYQLSGDYDNIREYVNRTVTLWATPSGSNNSAASSGQSQTGNQPMNDQTQTGNQAGNTQTGANASGSNAGLQPQIITVSRISLKSEQCDQPVK